MRRIVNKLRVFVPLWLTFLHHKDTEAQRAPSLTWHKRDAGARRGSRDIRFAGGKMMLYLLLVLGMQANVLAQKVEEVGMVSMTVADLSQSTRFFEEVLNFKKIFETIEHGKALDQLFGIDSVRIRKAHLTLGEEKIALIQFMAPEGGRKIPMDSKSNDLWFHHIAIVVSDMDRVYARLRQHHVKHVSTSPQTLPDYIPAAAGISAFYFRDPDDHNLEIIYFPEGKGNPRWQTTGDQLLLGIDHTAFAVANTQESLIFYRDILGMQVGGQSENYGPEQEHLNQVFGARLLITGLHGDKGMGLEFLNYLAPPGGRPYPENSKPNDLWHWHTELKVQHIKQVYQKLQKAGAAFISNRIVDLQKYHFNAKSGFLVRDPNGHVLLITE